MSVRRNADGRLIGESHPRAKLTDAEVDAMRNLREDESVGLDMLALIFDTPIATVRDIVRYRRR